MRASSSCTKRGLDQRIGRIRRPLEPSMMPRSASGSRGVFFECGEAIEEFGDEFAFLRGHDPVSQ